jgi:purine-binding chemotaxis protein CheW
MRPLPIRPLGGLPAGVAGMSIVRGDAVPVIDLAPLLDETGASPTRFVRLATGRRFIVLAVDAVVGIRAIPEPVLRALPPLLRDPNRDAVAAIGLLDAELIWVLNSAALLTEAEWAAIDAGEEP